MTEIDKAIIAESVDQKIAISKDRKGEYALKIFEEAKELVTMNPNALDAAVHLISSKLDNLNRENCSDELYGSNESLKALVKLEEAQDLGEVIPIIRTGFAEFDELIPLPVNEAFILMPAAPNCGKTTTFIALGNNILDNNDDTMVIMQTTDDSRDIYFNRFVSNRSQIHMNWIKNPKYYLNEDLNKKRKIAYRHVSEWIREEKLIIKDAINGTSVEYLGNLIKYYREKYPNRKIVVFCDNFHKLSTESGIEDKRLRTEYISQLVKGYTNKYDCIVFATVELGKMGMHEKPTNAGAIKETGALEYDANLILFLWNSLNSERNKEVATFDSSVMTYNKDTASYIHKPVKKPIIEMLVLKNKLSEYKGEFYYKLHPELAFIDFMTHQEFEELKAPPIAVEEV
jgi:replicative DNA helicase